MALPTFQSARADEDKEKPLARIKIEINVNSPASEKSGKGATVVRVERQESHEKQKEAHEKPKRGWVEVSGTRKRHHDVGIVELGRQPLRQKRD